jgi:hypothetical protein
MIGAFHGRFKPWRLKKGKKCCRFVDFQLTLNVEQHDIAAKSLKYMDIFKH